MGIGFGASTDSGGGDRETKCLLCKSDHGRKAVAEVKSLFDSMLFTEKENPRMNRCKIGLQLMIIFFVDSSSDYFLD